MLHKLMGLKSVTCEGVDFLGIRAIKVSFIAFDHLPPLRVDKTTLVTLEPTMDQ